MAAGGGTAGLRPGGLRAAAGGGTAGATTRRPTRSSRRRHSRRYDQAAYAQQQARHSRATTRRPTRSSRRRSRRTTRRPTRSSSRRSRRYAQQQAAYAQQQAAAQPAYDQAAYDQAAYAQQQAAYAQQQAAYAAGIRAAAVRAAARAAGYYDPSAYGQQAYGQPYGQQPAQPYYDPSAYGQQPSYYDQQAYPQQQWQGYPPPTQPYAYGQPGQPAWPAEAPYWDKSAGGYGRSFAVVLAGFVLLTWGVIYAVGGGLIMWLGNLDEVVKDLTLSAETMDLVAEFNKQASAYGALLLILGITQSIGAVGILAHRAWGRAFGVVLGLLGTILGIGLLISSVDLNVGDQTIKGTFSDDPEALGLAILVFVSYAFIFLAMYAGRRHFRKKGVS